MGIFHTVSHMAIEVDIHDRFTWGMLPCLSFSSNVISHLTITVSHMAIEVDIHDRFTWGILPCLSFGSNVISHLTNTVTFMTNSIGESRHVGHSIIRFKSIYFYAVNSLIVQYMHTCIYLTDILNTNNSNQYTYTYMYFTNSIYNRSQSHLSSYHLCMTNISNNNHSNQYIYVYIYIFHN